MVQKDGNVVFAHFDGDDIGPQLELMLLDNKLEDAREYSRLVSSAMASVRDRLSSFDSVDIVFLGGDDLVASWPTGRVVFEDVELIRKTFHAICKRTLSVGIGTSPKYATENLHRAKLMGKNQVVLTEMDIT